MKKAIPTHIAIIMDGNGRWAKARGKQRVFGHEAGAKVIDKIVDCAIKQKISCLSLFAFSTENWNRPLIEVKFIMKLLEYRLNAKLITNLNKNGIKFHWCGLANGLSKKLIDKLLLVQKVTARNKKLTLNLCFNYGGMQDILQAANQIKENLRLQDFQKLLLTKDLPPVDLLVRTGDEKRISNFLLFQSAYAEIIFEKALWPDYGPNIFIGNLHEYASRKRRFGGLHV